MLARQYRLHKNAHFNYAYRRGRSCSNRVMKLVYVRSGPPDGLRVGFSVSKKVGNAVVRNRTKRRMREAMRALLPHMKRGYYVVFVAYSQCAEATYLEIAQSQRSLLQKGGLVGP